MKTTERKPQAATITPGDDPQNARNLGGEKETVRTLALVVFDPVKATFHHPVEARWYMGRSRHASIVHCSVWIGGPELYRSGYDQAGGYGYHKESAAFAGAVQSAGIELAVDVRGVGDGAVQEAMRAIAAAVGYAGLPMDIA